MDARGQDCSDVFIICVCELLIEIKEVNFKSIGAGLVVSKQVVQRALHVIFVKLVEAWQVVQRSLLNRKVITFSRLLVESKYRVKVLEMQIQGAQLKGNLPDHLGHPLNSLVRVLVEVESPDHVRDEVGFN